MGFPLTPGFFLIPVVPVLGGEPPLAYARGSVTACYRAATIGSGAFPISEDQFQPKLNLPGCGGE
jgi:hypothetical protein